MKKFVKKLFCAALTVVVVCGVVSNLGACEKIEDIIADFLQKNTENSSRQNDEYEVEVETESLSEMNKVVTAAEAVKKNQHSTTVKESWFDDEGNYNYIVYLGRIDNFLLHNVYSFQYTKNFKVFGNAQITRKEATVETVSSVYEKTIRNTTSRTVENSITTGFEISPAVSELLGDSVKLSVENQLKNVFTDTCTETDYSSYTTITTKTQETIREFTLDYDKCVENETYSYCVVTDVDVYAALCYNPEKNSLRYDYYSDAVGIVRDIVFISDDRFFNRAAGSFEYDFSSFSFEKPEKFISNHNPIKHRHLAPENMYVKNYSAKCYYVNFGAYKKNNGQEVPYISYIKDCGYTKIDIKVTFYYVQHESGKWYFYLCRTNNKNIYIGKSEGGATGKVELFYENVDLDLLADYNQICLIFESIHLFNGYDVNSLVVEFTVHQ